MEAITFKRLFGRVDRSMYEELEKKLHTLHAGTCIFLILKSDGGDLEWGRKICSLLHRVAQEKKITTIGFAYGNVHSAALRIFLMCHYRIGLPTSKYLVHLPKDNTFEIDDRDVVLVNNEEISFFATMTGAPDSVVRQLFYQSVCLGAAQAHNLGITNIQVYQRPQKPLLATS